MEWYAFYPAGTLLFKGAEPMEMGSDHHSSDIFPPPGQTVVGALRTAVLEQNNISYRDDSNKNVSPEILTAIGEAENREPFTLIGPLFSMNQHIFIPAPFIWFYDKAEKKNRKVRVFRALPKKSRLIKNGEEELFWVAAEGNEMVSMGGRWIYLEDLFSTDEKINVFDVDHFFTTEPRTGIALNRNRSIREGHLYTFNHVRLKPEVTLTFGVDVNLPIADKGVLKIGAEQRFGHYEKIEKPNFPSVQSDLFLSLGLVNGSQRANQTVIATGKIQYIGGWDLKKGFHKPMQGYFPAGSVFSENTNNNFVQI